MGADLTLLSPFDGLMDLSPLSPLTDAAPETLASVRITVGRSAVLLEELFSISPAPGDTLALDGDLSRAIRIGADLSHGTLIVRGSAGAEAGRNMTGGTLIIEGDAGDHALSGMQNGFAQIRGSAGDGLARLMRRGVIVVSGRCGSGACARMLGGTVLLNGGAGDGLCLGMSRGTVILPAGADAPDGFSRAADVDLTFTRLLYCMLRERSVRLPECWYGAMFARYRGDPAALGKGEVLIPEMARV